MKALLLLCCLLSKASEAHDFQAHAKKLHSSGKNLAQTTSPQVVPGFQTDAPPQTKFSHVDDLQEAASSAVNQNPHSQWLKKSAENRPYFRLDPTKDPLFDNTHEMVEDSEAFLARGKYASTRTKGTFLKKCEESRPDTVYTCTQTLLEPTLHIEPAKYAHYWCSQGNHRPDDPRCRAKTYYNPARKYKDEVVTVTHEKWTSTCQALEERTRKGLCRHIKKVCPKGPETRDIVASTSKEGKPITRAIRRDCWYYELDYQCDTPSKNNCGPLRQAKCSQVGSKCLKDIEGVCLNWEQTFKCPKDVFPEEQIHTFRPMSLTTSEKSPVPRENTELGQAITQLEVLNKVQGEIKAAGGTNLPLKVFKGSVSRCTVAFANFKNCCAKEKGWGVSLNLSGCSGEDQQTNQRVKDRKCIDLGKYCAEKVLGVCIRKKRTYCCFDTKLARVLHEQGRRFGWGSAEKPDCRGFTVQELASLNFDAINFSEVFDDVLASMNPPQASTLNRNLSDRLTQMTSSFGNRSKREAY